MPRENLRRWAPSVTVAVLSVLAEVLPRFGGADPDGRVVAETTVAGDPIDGQRNNFHTVGVDCFAAASTADRAAAIADRLADVRRRHRAPGQRWGRKAAAATPAVLEAVAARLSAQAPLPARVAGATVVSSVDRGPADLTLNGGRVLFTAGFPALSPVHGLTHGVHGIGDRITVSVAARGAAADIVDAYVAALAELLA